MKISVIVPVYNTKKYLKRCLESIINQSLKEIEIIVINDGSKEEIDDIIDKYIDKITYIENDNHGIGYTRNLGIQKATGEYIGFVDSDDTIEEDMYLKYYKYAKDNDLDIVVGNYYTHYNEYKEKTKIKSFSTGNIYENRNILVNINYGPCNKIFRRNMIIDNDIWFEESLKFEDLPFVLKALKHSEKVGYLNEFCYNYNIRNLSETKTIDKRNFDIFKIFDIINDYFKEDKILKEEIEYLNISKLLDYNIQQKYQNDKILRNKFIDYTFEYIKEKFPNYKNNKYFKKYNIFKKIIMNSKMLTKIYCFIYSK